MKRVKCKQCGHPVAAHKKALPKYTNYSLKELAAIIGTSFRFCDITICEQCPAIIIRSDILVREVLSGCACQHSKIENCAWCNE